MNDVRIHPSWEKVGGIPLAIMRGEHDDDLEAIQDACKKRTKSMFRKNQRCTLTGTKSVELDGKEVLIEKVNSKTISVRVIETGLGYNVPPRMLVAS